MRTSPPQQKSIYNLLVENIKTFKVKSRVTAICGNGIPCIKKLGSKNIKASFVTLDPPWGGRSYLKKKINNPFV